MSYGTTKVRRFRRLSRSTTFASSPAARPLSSSIAPPFGVARRGRRLRDVEQLQLELVEHGLHLRARERVDVSCPRHPLDQLDHTPAVHLAIKTKEFREPRELEDAANLRSRRGPRVAARAQPHERHMVD